MQLSRYTDYALRILVYLYMHDDRLCSIHEIATYYEISQNHLMKIVHKLGKGGFIQTIRGRRGGLKLNRDAQDIKLGEIIQYTEEDIYHVNCVQCLIHKNCKLPTFLMEAMNSFYTTLSQYSLIDLFKQSQKSDSFLNMTELLPNH